MYIIEYSRPSERIGGRLLKSLKYDVSLIKNIKYI